MFADMPGISLNGEDVFDIAYKTAYWLSSDCTFLFLCGLLLIGACFVLAVFFFCWMGQGVCQVSLYVEL